ncbi:MAG: putative quinol monooxygenase [Stellaceae bacterium]
MVLRYLWLALLALAPGLFTGPALAQASQQQQYVVVYVEFLPAAAHQGGNKLNQLALLAHSSAGLVSFNVNQQLQRPNFYSLVEIWKDATAYQNFSSSADTQTLLNAIQPLLEAPFDYRPGNLVE